MFYLTVDAINPHKMVRETEGCHSKFHTRSLDELATALAIN